MTVFAITTNVQFTQKPEWLDSFFAKYNKEKYDFHVTLKQPCIIEPDQIGQIKELISKYFSEKNPQTINMVFNKLAAEATEEELASGKSVIMIEAEKNNEILALQKDLLQIFSGYRNFLSEETKEYEENFKPHITIAKDLDKEAFQSAKTDLQADYVCEAKLTRVILIFVHNYGETFSRREEIAFNLA